MRGRNVLDAEGGHFIPGDARAGDGNASDLVQQQLALGNQDRKRFSLQLSRVHVEGSDGANWDV